MTSTPVRRTARKRDLSPHGARRVRSSTRDSHSFLATSLCLIAGVVAVYDFFLLALGWH